MSSPLSEETHTLTTPQSCITAADPPQRANVSQLRTTNTVGNDIPQRRSFMAVLRVVIPTSPYDYHAFSRSISV
jgi:hypothetical protein